MDLLSFVAPLIAFAGAIVAVVGNTWDTTQSGWRKIRVTGWAAAGIALTGLSLSIVGAYQAAQEKSARRAAAIAEINIAWRGLVSPYRMMLWHIDGAQSNPDATLVARVLEEETLKRLNQIDLRGDAPHHHGPWTANICGSAKRGYEELRLAQTIYVGIVDAALITKMKDVATDYMIQAMMVLSPCGDWDPPRDYPLKLESITNFRELPRYLRALLELRKELDRG